MTRQRPRRASSHRERQRIERAIEMYLRKCYRERTPARVSELAEFLGTNRTHLSRVVPALLGEPLGAALRTRQLAYAERLLRETTLTVGEIAATAAFGTERTFFRAFLAAYGTTPAVFRKATNCQ